VEFSQKFWLGFITAMIRVGQAFHRLGSLTHMGVVSLAHYGWYYRNP
jgi:hypothetical protein